MPTRRCDHRRIRLDSPRILVRRAGCASSGAPARRRPNAAIRGRTFKQMTCPDTTAVRPPDLVTRRFVTTRPNQLWVADLTDTAKWQGLAYVALAGSWADACRVRCDAICHSMLW